MTYLGFALFAAVVYVAYHYLLHRSVRNDLADVHRSVETFESNWRTHHAAAPATAPAPVVVNVSSAPVAPVAAPAPVVPDANPFHLPAAYLAAEQQAPENYDRPDAQTLAYLLAHSPEACASVASAAPIGHPTRAALERAARILDGAGRYLQIEGGNADAAAAALHGDDPIFARWAAVMLAGVGNSFWGNAPTQVETPKDVAAPPTP